MSRPTKPSGRSQPPDTRSLEERIPEALEKTGFLLENQVAEAFRIAKWSVITNRYYVDDVDERARELDLIAYKVKSGKEIEVVTSILISCKKDAENAWTVMTRSRTPQDPNMDWEPVHYWTNHEILDTYLGSIDWRHAYATSNDCLKKELFDISRQAFAFQLISLDGNLPKNDRPIFQSLTDLMKAQDHELSILPGRMKKIRVYNFNLMTVVDAPIYEADCDTGRPVVREVTEFRHLARYIVRRIDRTARVQIVSSKVLIDAVKTYDALAAYDFAYYNDRIRDAYLSVKNNTAIQDVLAKKLMKRIRWSVNQVLDGCGRGRLDSSDELSLSFDKGKNELVLRAPFKNGDAGLLNDDKKLLALVGRELESVVHYVGDWRFEDDEIPF